MAAACHGIFCRVKFIPTAAVLRHFTSCVIYIYIYDSCVAAFYFESEIYIYGSRVAAFLLCVKFISMAAVSWHFNSTEKLVDDLEAAEPETVQGS